MGPVNPKNFRDRVIAPSLLAADFSCIGDEVSRGIHAGADWIHLDVMDGHFVPNISFGATVMKSLLGRTELPFDVHLMIQNPEKYIKDFVTPNTKYITVHLEACPGILGVLAAGAAWMPLDPTYPGERLAAMIEDGAPSLVEFNVRFGDPECQVLMLRLESDIVPYLAACANGSIISQASGKTGILVEQALVVHGLASGDFG